MRGSFLSEQRSSKLFLFERKSYKKKQKPFRFIDGAKSSCIPFDVLLSCLSHGRRTQKLPSAEPVAVSLCVKITFGVSFQFAMGVHKPLTPGEVPSLRGGEGFALSVASVPALPKGEPYEMFTLGFFKKSSKNIRHKSQVEFINMVTRTEKGSVCMNSNLPIPYEPMDIPYIRPHRAEKKKSRRRFAALFTATIFFMGLVFSYRFLPEEWKGFFGISVETTDESTTPEETTTENTQPEETNAPRDIYEWRCELPYGAVPIKPADRSAYELLLYAENKTNAVLEAITPYFPKKGSGEISVLVVNTHSYESYAEEGALYYTDSAFATSGEAEKRVSEVAKTLCKTLSENGIGAVFVDCMAESSFGSYQNAQRLLELALEKYPEVTLVIDIHRAILQETTGDMIRPITEIAGEIAAQARIVLGTDANFERNAAVSRAVYDILNLRYERLMMPLSVESGTFLQKLSVPVLTFEIGSAGNSVSEACYTAELLAQVMADCMLS